MYIVLEKTPAGGASNTVVIHIPIKTVRGVYDEEGIAIKASSASGSASIYSPGLNIATYKNKYIHEITVPDAPAGAAALLLATDIGGIKVEVKAPILTGPLAPDVGAALTYGGKKSRYQGKTKKSHHRK